MKPQEIEELLFTLDLCFDALPFDLLPVHAQRIEAIKQILTETRERKTPAAPTRILSLCRPPLEPGRNPKTPG